MLPLRLVRSNRINIGSTRFVRLASTTSASGKPSNVMLALLATVGAGSYYMYQQQTGLKHDVKELKKVEATSLKRSFGPETTVVFVLGGPGAGKGTQSANLVKDYGFVHLSAGDLLRAERERPGSQYGDLINDYIKNGQIVPMEITIALLDNAMKASSGDKFLIDGFPRKMDQAIKFEETVAEAKLVLYFECPEEEMLNRLLKRGETSGRVDDNIESIRKRFVTFKETSFPVIEAYQQVGKAATVSCMGTETDVYSRTRAVMDKLLKDKIKLSV